MNETTLIMRMTGTYPKSKRLKQISKTKCSNSDSIYTPEQIRFAEIWCKWLIGTATEDEKRWMMQVQRDYLEFHRHSLTTRMTGTYPKPKRRQTKVTQSPYEAI